MARDVPDWLIQAFTNPPRGFQAEVARRARMGQTKLSKIINGRQALKLNESEALKEAISFLSVEPRFAERNGGAPEPEGSKLIDRIIGKRPSGGRPAELVFLLTDRNYMDFQLDQRLLEELRQALRDMAGS